MAVSKQQQTDLGNVDTAKSKHEDAKSIPDENPQELGTAKSHDDVYPSPSPESASEHAEKPVRAGMEVSSTTASAVDAFACKKCNKLFTSQLKLERHVRRYHHDRKFVCRHCSRSFVRSDHYRYHLQSHASFKPYECLSCGHFYLHFASLQRHHQQTDHKGFREHSQAPAKSSAAAATNHLQQQNTIASAAAKPSPPSSSPQLASQSAPFYPGAWNSVQIMPSLASQASQQMIYQSNGQQPMLLQPSSRSVYPFQYPTFDAYSASQKVSIPASFPVMMHPHGMMHPMHPQAMMMMMMPSYPGMPELSQPPSTAQ